MSSNSIKHQDAVKELQIFIKNLKLDDEMADKMNNSLEFILNKEITVIFN